MKKEASFPWARPSPLPRPEAIEGLHVLREDCTSAQRSVRHEAFGKAEIFIKRQPVLVDVAPVFRTFQNRALPPNRRDARVDIEVIEGLAFS